MAKTAASKKEEKKNDMPILFFFGLAASGGLIWLLNKGKKSGAAATLNGILDDDGGAPADLSFEWGETDLLESETPKISAVAGDQFSARLTGLARGMTYYYRAKAVGLGGTTFGETLTFIT